MNSRHWIWIIAGLAIVVALVAVRIKRMNEKENTPLLKPAPVSVDVASVTRGSVARTRHVLGKVIGDNEAAVAPRIMAYVLSVNVREGDRVQKGALLAQLDPREIKDAVAQSEAALSAAHTAYETQRDATARDSVLFSATAISQEQWDRSRTARDAAFGRWRIAQKARDQAHTRLTYTRITAPFDGVVAARLSDPGDLAVPGRPIIQLVQQSGVRVRAGLPATDFALLKTGQPVRLVLGETAVQATVSRVFPALGDDHLAAVEIDLSNPPVNFVSGATVGIDLTLHATESLQVPTDALLEGENSAFVFVVSDGTIRPAPVKILNRSLDLAAVSGVIEEGEQIVVARPSRLMTLAAGTPVVMREEVSP